MKNKYLSWPKRAIILSACIILVSFLYQKKELILNIVKLNQTVTVNSDTDDIFYGSVGSPDKDRLNSKNNPVKISKKYTVEIMATKNRDQAEKTIQNLLKHNINGFYIPLQNGPDVIYRVRVGLYKSHKKAKNMASTITKKSGFKTTVKIFL